jgi:hypothetical protein
MYSGIHVMIRVLELRSYSHSACFYMHTDNGREGEEEENCTKIVNKIGSKSDKFQVSYTSCKVAYGGKVRGGLQ